MSGGDGAHLGYSAETSLKAILGAEQPAEDAAMDPRQMMEWILSAPGEPFPDDNGQAYDACARYAARLVLQWLLADPTRAQSPTETEYDWNADPDRGVEGRKPEYTKAVGWYDRMKDDGVPIGDLGLSGFMWGWAVNAARRCAELPAVPNPAIMTIGGDE